MLVNKDKEQEKQSSGLKSKLAEIKANTEEVKAMETTNPETRIVRLVVGEECGCGGVDIDIDREVPFDSPLQNGDRVAEFEDADIIL